MRTPQPGTTGAQANKLPTADLLHCGIYTEDNDCLSFNTIIMLLSLINCRFNQYFYIFAECFCAIILKSLILMHVVYRCLQVENQQECLCTGRHGFETSKHSRRSGTKFNRNSAKPQSKATQWGDQSSNKRTRSNTENTFREQ